VAGGELAELALSIDWGDDPKHAFESIAEQAKRHGPFEVFRQASRLPPRLVFSTPIRGHDAD
jgi:hypothetical protein